MKPSELREREFEKKEEQKKESEGNEWNKMIEEDEDVELREIEFEKKEERRKEEYEKRKRSLENEMSEDEIVMTENGFKDTVGAKYMRRVENEIKGEE